MCFFRHAYWFLVSIGIRVCRLAGVWISLCCSIVICHRPCNGQEPEQKRKPSGAPSRAIGEMSENPAGRLFVWSKVEEDNADANRRRYYPIRSVFWIHKLSAGNVLFIGANHRMIRCRDFVVKELSTPRMHRITMDRTTVCNADLGSRLVASQTTDTA